METVIDKQEIKKKCQIFTPDKIVFRMLECAKYKKDLFGKKVLENSCGDGQILSKIIIAYIEDALQKHLPKEVIIQGLEEDIFAFDIDPEQVDQCRKNLSEIALSYGLGAIKWNVTCADFLSTNNLPQFDFIIGNPPYISYQDLQESIRIYLKEHFRTCKKGKFDYCYAFLEKSYDLLTNDGVLVYLIPSNVFKNVFAYEIRSLIQNDLESIIDYPSESVFTNALVSPAIIKVKKGEFFQTLSYCVSDRGEEHEIVINKRDLGKKWAFNLEKDCIGKKVGDYFRVSSSVATLLNEAFLIRDCSFDDEFCYFGDTRIEKGIVKKAASPKSKKNEKNEYLIFPYYFDSNNIVRLYSEKQMNERFPLTISYLKTFKEQLEKRNADKKVAWYGYGRSQALQNSNQKMLLISSIVSKCTRAYYLSADEIPYSGLYIIKTGEISLLKLMSRINTPEFIRHIQNVGVCVNGQSKRITPDDVKSYVFEIE